MTTNLEHVGYDEDFPRIPHFLTTIPPVFYNCQKVVKKAICRFACLLGYLGCLNVLNGYRRSYTTAQGAEEYFMRYDVPEHTVEKDETYYTALKLVLDWFRPPRLVRPVHFTDLRWYPWKVSTSAERPFVADKELRQKLVNAKFEGWISNARLSFNNLYNVIFEYSRTYIHQVKDGLTVRLHPIQLHVKPALVSITGEEKVRTIFGVPKMLIFAEAMFLWPLFNQYFRLGFTPLLWNYETLNGGWYRLNDEWNSRFKEFSTVFSLDWSSFDMLVYFTVWDDLRKGVESYFDWSGQYIPTRTYPDAKTEPRRLRNLWNWIGFAYKNTECVTTTGKRFLRKFAGMPSGIFGTQFWDSLYNALMIVTVLTEMGLEVRKEHAIKILGDDGIVGLLCLLPPWQHKQFMQDFASVAKRRFNAVLNVDKSNVTQTINGAKVLGYTNYNGHPFRSTVDLLAQLLWPKSYNDSYEKLMARSVGIAYASAGDTKVYAICKDIYDYLQSLGIKPDYTGFTSLFDPNFSGPSGITLTTFPTMLEIVCRLDRRSHRATSVTHSYWNRHHFLDEA